MLFTETRGRAVTDLATAETLGTVAACTIAPSPARITGLRLRTPGHGHHVLEWKDVRSFGPDVVVVERADRIRRERTIAPGEPAHAAHDPLGKTVLAETGLARGTLVDIDFDERSGHIHRLVTDQQRIPGDGLLGVGSYAVVVTAPR
ncbi:hypothetical protein ACFXPN_05180 [Streptomyces griseorubiginosus]|uniref:hypothetical protein n=1 Tax=Streptomyces griseorubiginosus TaxID=67304 RepID=UPI0036D13FE4